MAAKRGLAPRLRPGVGGGAVTLFEAPIWAELTPHIRVVTYSRRHDMARLEFNLPFDLLERALQTQAACVACGKPVQPIRLRKVKAARSRVADLPAAYRAFYAAACATNVNPSCQRTKAVRSHMQGLRLRFGCAAPAPGLMDDHALVEAYRHLCTQLLGALTQRGDHALTAWVRSRCRSIESPHLRQALNERNVL